MGIMQKKIAIVIPCYNESNRLKSEEFKKYIIDNENVSILFVNDGSTDDTFDVIKRIRDAFPDNAICISLKKNGGKANAVRKGFLEAIDLGFDYIGYLDADLSTPINEMNRLSHLLERDKLSFVMASRVRLLGRGVERNPVRHYLGRLFATFASIVLKINVYDTQCGAKIFSNNLELKRVFSRAFRVKWTFDVEILARYKIVKKMLNNTPIDQSVLEYPLENWRDVGGSKVKLLDFLVAGIELFKIYTYLYFPVIKKHYSDLFDE